MACAVACLGLVALGLGAIDAVDLGLADARVVDAAHLDRRLVRQPVLVHAHDRLLKPGARTLTRTRRIQPLTTNTYCIVLHVEHNTNTAMYTYPGHCRCAPADVPRTPPPSASPGPTRCT